MVIWALLKIVVMNGGPTLRNAERRDRLIHPCNSECYFSLSKSSRKSNEEGHRTLHPVLAARGISFFDEGKSSCFSLCPSVLR